MKFPGNGICAFVECQNVDLNGFGFGEVFDNFPYGFRFAEHRDISVAQVNLLGEHGGDWLQIFCWRSGAGRCEKVRYGS